MYTHRHFSLIYLYVHTHTSIRRSYHAARPFQNIFFLLPGFPHLRSFSVPSTLSSTLTLTAWNRPFYAPFHTSPPTCRQVWMCAHELIYFFGQWQCPHQAVGCEEEHTASALREFLFIEMASETQEGRSHLDSGMEEAELFRGLEPEHRPLHSSLAVFAFKLLFKN